MITIDAQNKKLGRLASEVAHVLMGKDTTDFARNKAPMRDVTIVNASQMSIEPRKLLSKEYIRYTGFPGGLKTERMDAVIARKGYGDVIRTAVYGMLPANKLRPLAMKRLTITE